jgi:hypothetical protein
METLFISQTILSIMPPAGLPLFDGGLQEEMDGFWPGLVLFVSIFQLSLSV